MPLPILRNFPASSAVVDSHKRRQAGG